MIESSDPLFPLIAPIFTAGQATMLIAEVFYRQQSKIFASVTLKCAYKPSSFYPPDTPIPDETAIPFWATTDRMSFDNFFLSDLIDCDSFDVA